MSQSSSSTPIEPPKQRRQLSVKNKIILSALVLAILPVLAANFFLGARAIHHGSSIATHQAEQLLGALRDTKQAQIVDYLNGLEKQLTAIAASAGTVQATKNFSASVMDFGDIDPPSKRELGTYRQNVLEYYRSDYSKAYHQLSSGEVFNSEALAKDMDSTNAWLQFRFVKMNPHKVNEKQKMRRNVMDQLPYDDYHAEYHPGFLKLIQKLNFRDLYLVDIHSDRVVYSVNKGADYGVKLSATHLENSGLGKVYQRIKNNPKATFAAEDFNDYSPAFHQLAGFVAVPVYETVEKSNVLTNIKQDGFFGTRRVGVLIVRLDDEVITTLLTNNQQWADVGLGQSGEVYLVNRNKKVASDLRSLLENEEAFNQAMHKLGLDEKKLEHIKNNHSTAGIVEVHTHSVDLALTGERGVIEEKNYLGDAVLTAYGPLNAFGLQWAVLAQMATSEALAPVSDMKDAITKVSWIVGALVIMIAIALALFFARRLVAPLESIERTVNRLNRGQFEARCRIKTGDEYQSLGDAIDTMVDERAEFLRSEEASKLLNKHIIQVLEAVSELSERNLTVNVPVTEDVIGPVADALNLMTEEISDMMRRVRTISDQVGSSSVSLEVLADDVERLSAEERHELESMITQLSDASQSLSEISDIAENSNSSAQEARGHVQQAHETVQRAAAGMHNIRETIHETEKRIKRLGERSQEISGITDIINAIAERTHVLSINASIQAAAAGDAGRGFSVVAEEVQRLAESSRSATAQIATLVKNIQVETLDASETMARTIEQVVAGSELADEAGQIMKQSDDITAVLAATMNAIAQQSINQAKLGQQLQSNAEHLRQKSEQTTNKIQAQHEETDQLTNFSLQLQKNIASFKLG